MTSLRLIAAAALVMSLSASLASALTASADLEPTGGACSVASVSGASACSGVWKGNDSNQDMTGLFGIGDWQEILKLDDDHGTEAAGDMTLAVANKGDGGSWTLTGYNDFESLMFVLKGGNGFSAFMIDPAQDLLSGTWDTKSMKGGLSHWTVYGVPVDVTSMPLPGAGLLLIGGLGALVVRNRRRKTV